MRLALVLAALLLAGCLDPISERLRAGDVEPPRWQVGDWFRYELASEVYDGAAATLTVVVANVTSDGFILGVPADEDPTFALLFHMPALGPVAEELAWDVHEERFEPLRFPLEDGLEWDTTWISASVHLTAKLDRANATWNVTNVGHEEDAGLRYDILYDPAIGAITKFARTGVGADTRVRQSITLVENGTGYEGAVRTFGNQRVVLLDSRTQGVVAGGAPAAPASFTMPEGVDTALVACIVGGGPGQYHADVQAPAGGICTLDETLQPGDASYRVQALEVQDVTPEGAWQARLLAGGPGSATAEVLAYATADVSLA